MRTLYTFFVAIFFTGLFFYLINFALVPYDENNMIDVRSLIVVSVTAVCSVSSIFSVIHQIVDKLFFRKFYEKARIGLSIRRGVFLSGGLISLVWLRIFGFWEWHVIALTLCIPVLFEILFSNVHRVEDNDKEEARSREGNPSEKGNAELG